jgi:DNA-binding transcriptional ArsR family regulator
VFLVFSNNMFTAFTYAFSDHTHYNALQLLKVQRFVIADEEIPLAEVRYFLESFHDFREPEVQFPQADSFERVVDLLGILAERPLSREEITERYAFDKRQTSYYSDAARYLGLLEKEREGALIVYRLTSAGRAIMRKRPKDKTLDLIRAILSRKIFNEACKITLSAGHLPSNERLATVFAQAGLAIPINATTMARRSSTVRKWVDWIVKQCV